ncbi:dUTP diphosphatase [Candidatus Woesebacteria bacterium]|nr:dUTP diphosphatase [Candidatus Woesebacteria bacterium]
MKPLQKLNIKLIDQTLPIPQYHTRGAVAFDVYSRVDMVIEPWKPSVIPLNLVVAVPDGCFLMLSARSSTAKKFGLMVANGVGIIDQDYCGDNDEIGFSVLNFTGEPVHIEKGDRVGQATLVSIAKAEKFVVVEKMQEKDRGGWGSTGH